MISRYPAATLDARLVDSPTTDPAGRLRVSNPEVSFGASTRYNSQLLHFNHTVSGSGAVAHSATTGEITLSTGAAGSGDRAVRQTTRYWGVVPGIGGAAKLMGVLHSSGTHADASLCQCGWYDDDNGVGFGVDATGEYVFRRTDQSGSVVTTKIYSGSWNPPDGYPTLDDAGLVMDVDDVLSYVVDVQWAGSSRVRYGVERAGVTYYVHEEEAAGAAAGEFLREVELPLRWEVHNEGGTGADVEQIAIAGAVLLEGAGRRPEHPFSFGSGVTAVSCTTGAQIPVVSWRLASTLNGIDYRGSVAADRVTIQAATNPVYWQLQLNATLGGSPSYGAVDATHSGVEFDVAATSISAAGTVLASGYVGAGETREVDLSRIGRHMGKDLGGTSDILTFSGRGVGGTADVLAAVDITEYY